MFKMVTLSSVVVMMVVMVSFTRGQGMGGLSMGGGGLGGGPPPGLPPQPMGHGYPQVRSSHCRYLVNAPSPWGLNASPFKLYTRSYAGEVRRGYPVEVTIMPAYEGFKRFNFTDFAMWAEPMASGPAPPAPSEMAWGGGAANPPPAAPSVTHVGVWKVFPQYAGGATSMRCNMYSRGEDTVGTYEERMLELLKAQFPGDNRLGGFNPSQRSAAAFLWYPDENALKSGAIKFVAKLKAFTQWFHLESTPWRVYQPPPPPRPMSFSNFIDVYSNMAGQARSMERQLDQATV